MNLSILPICISILYSIIMLRDIIAKKITYLKVTVYFIIAIFLYGKFPIEDSNITKYPLAYNNMIYYLEIINLIIFFIAGIQYFRKEKN
jgi:hypothetical protein